MKIPLVEVKFVSTIIKQVNCQHLIKLNVLYQPRLPSLSVHALKRFPKGIMHRMLILSASFITVEK